MGNIGSSAARRERRRRISGHRDGTVETSPSPVADMPGDRHLFASPTATRPNPSGPPRYQYPALDHHRHHHNWAGGHVAAAQQVTTVDGFSSSVKRQTAVTIRNDVNLKKETLRLESDELNPGCFLVAFTFDATVAGRISICFFAREGAECSLTPTQASCGRSFAASFEEGLGQEFRQPAGSGISSSTLEEAESGRPPDVYALAVKAESCPPSGERSALITQAAVEKRNQAEGGVEWEARVVKQVLWVDGTRYELQEIYGIGNSVDINDPGKDCVICLSEPRDTTVLPCRHMCMCSDCAKVLGLQTNRCPICRQPIERLLEIKVSGEAANTP